MQISENIILKSSANNQNGGGESLIIKKITDNSLNFN